MQAILFNKYYFGNQIKKDYIGGHVALMLNIRNAYKNLVGKPEGKTMV